MTKQNIQTRKYKLHEFETSKVLNDEWGKNKQMVLSYKQVKRIYNTFKLLKATESGSSVLIYDENLCKVRKGGEQHKYYIVVEEEE